MPVPGEWTLSDPTVPNSEIVVDIANDELEWESEEIQASFNTIGGTYPLVVKDEHVKADKWEAIFEFLDQDDKDAFEAMRQTQRRLLLTSPFPGLSWYFVFGPNGRWTLLNPHTPWWRFTCQIIEVEYP